MIYFKLEIRASNTVVLNPLSSLLESCGEHWHPQVNMKACSPFLNVVQPVLLCYCLVVQL